MFDPLTWWIIGGIVGGLLVLTIDAIIEKYVMPFFNKCRNVQKATVIKKKDIKRMLSSVSPEKRSQAQAVWSVLNAQANDVVMYGRDYSGQVWYETVTNVEDCEDLNNSAYEVTRSGYKQKIHIG